MHNVNSIIIELKEAFKNHEIKLNVLDKEWYDLNIKTGINSTGFCFYASEVIYKLCGGKKYWILKRIPKEVFPEGPHYFLFNKITKEILDVTEDQYTKRDIKIPYDKGIGRGIQNTSKKAKKLAEYIGHYI
jgi:hypothetical protein